MTIPTTGTGTTQLTYKLVIANGATIPDAISIPAVVTVIEPVPVITLFTFDPSGTTKTFAPGADVVFDHMYDAKGGTATVNGVPASASGSTTTIHNIRASTVYTLTVTTPLGRSITQSVTANVSAQVDAFSVGATQAASMDTAIISAGGNTKLFAALINSCRLSRPAGVGGVMISQCRKIMTNEAISGPAVKITRPSRFGKMHK